MSVDYSAEWDKLHIALCQIVALLNQGSYIDALDIARKALAETPNENH